MSKDQEALNYTLSVLPGELLEESQLEASRLRQKVEDLVKDNEMLRSTSPFEKFEEIAGTRILEQICECPSAKPTFVH